ncbi:serine--tRNA synthetase-like protein Slimp [Maniola jurtina]|uniref:serine--tRNA synthetase-like protein Slimp n=1 Tax=Maniola jurtina TaxID=191418 RepID=UPI001E686D46|nr:serine--tRNA synthetase-like protein Slimp [Maniola jurtina]
MMCKASYILSNKPCLPKILKRSSALFINGPKATDNFVYVTPHIDFPERIKQKDVLKSELRKRQSKINLDKLENLWFVYEELKSRKTELDKKKVEVSMELGNLLKEGSTGDSVEKLKIQVALLKENIKKLKVPLWSAEEMAIVESLKLSNSIHPLTPDGGRNILFEYSSRPSNNKNHLKIGKDYNLINFTKNENYYLLGDAAVFELGANFYFSKILKQKNFIQFSNPDFTKSLVIEGCGTDHTNPDSTFILHHNEDTEGNSDNRLHLTGAGSLYSFFAYHTKNVLYNKVLPLKYFTIGRQYVPSPIEESSLLHASQSSVVEMFIATKSSTELYEVFDQVINITRDLYTQLGYHFRLSLVPANELNMWESLRLAIEMYSSSHKGYVEVGNISLSGDFISKRLMFTYTEEKQTKFPHILSGTILNVPKFLACVLEQNNDFVVPELFRVEQWSMKPK